MESIKFERALNTLSKQNYFKLYEYSFNLIMVSSLNESEKIDSVKKLCYFKDRQIENEIEFINNYEEVKVGRGMK